jgi:lipopolysaccharide export system protein LptC
MSPQPLTSIGPQHKPGDRLAASGRARQTPTARHLARRRFAVTVTKWLLPALALALLSSIALWPEFNRTAEQARLAFRQISGQIHGAELIDARYHGIDAKGRPYTVTAATAQQAGRNRFNLTSPKADITLQDGTWLMLQAKKGVYRREADALDLSHAVTLYRDDGTTMVTNSASIDIKNGAAAGGQPVLAEGPFGTLNAQGFTLLDKGAIIQFTGHAHLVLNGATVGASTQPVAAQGTPAPGPTQ